MHEQQVVDCGPEPHVVVELIEGDLMVEGVAGERLAARSRGHGNVSVTQEGEGWVIRGDRDCRVTLPRASHLVITEVRGDLSLRGIDPAVEIDRVGGGAVLEDLGGVDAGSVGGDVRAERLRGGFSLRHGGGDGRLADLPGPIAVSFGGDLVARGVVSPLTAEVGGDGVVDIELGPEGGIELKAGGDITCRLGGTPSAQVSILAGGSRQVHLPAHLAPDGSGRWILGKGGPSIDLRAGSDVWLGGDQTPPGSGDPDDIGVRVAASVGKTLAEMEASLSAVGAIMETLPEAEISSKVQRLVERSMRRRLRHQKARRTPVPAQPGAVSAVPPVQDEEKLKILRMVEDGKLSVEDAEKLFEALEA